MYMTYTNKEKKIYIYIDVSRLDEQTIYINI